MRGRDIILRGAVFAKSWVNEFAFDIGKAAIWHVTGNVLGMRVMGWTEHAGSAAATNLAEISECLRIGWLPPPLAPAKAFYPFGCGRNFLLFSRVMRVGLSTASGAKRPGRDLSGSIFSGPHDCADLVNCL